eukprot:282791-Lingulodinium_polyedra.AAC.1
MDALYSAARSDWPTVSMAGSLADEVRLLKGLVFLAGVDMGAAWAAVAYCSDACPSGFALHEA